MKNLQEMIKDLTGINVEQNKIKDYLKDEQLNLRCADLTTANLNGTKIREQQLQQLTITINYYWGGKIMNIKNAWLTFISVNWNKYKDKKYKCYWKDNSIDILTLSELYFNFLNTSELNNLLRIKEIKEDK